MRSSTNIMFLWFLLHWVLSIQKAKHGIGFVHSSEAYSSLLCYVFHFRWHFKHTTRNCSSRFQLECRFLLEILPHGCENYSWSDGVCCSIWSSQCGCNSSPTFSRLLRAGIFLLVWTSHCFKAAVASRIDHFSDAGLRRIRVTWWHDNTQGGEGSFTKC